MDHPRPFISPISGIIPLKLANWKIFLASFKLKKEYKFLSGSTKIWESGNYVSLANSFII